MEKVLIIFSKKEAWLVVLLLLITLFFRAYKLKEFYGFDHDEDLYSWIVKDIWIDHHFRLIGQLTSIEGVFVGPLFYYALVPFYVLFNLNPLAANGLTILISLLTAFSIYFIFSKFFNKQTGLFGALIYATSIGIVEFDRWVVPTQPTLLWTVWYIYCLFTLAKGQYKFAIPLAAFLIALIWHVHIALLPLIFPLILAYLISGRKKIPIKTITISALLFLAISSPFWIFELKHNFLQTRSLFLHRSGVGEIPMGIDRFYKFIDSTQKVIVNSFFQEWNLPGLITPLLVLVTFILSVAQKFFTLKQTILIGTWFLSVLMVQLVTKNQISEYYVSNFMILPILFMAVFLGQMAKSQKIFKLINVILIAYVLFNGFILVKREEPWHRFKYKEQTVDYLKADALKNGYPCIALNYIHTTAPNTGFRYLLWWKGLKLVNYDSGAPEYDIVIPYDLYHEKLDAQFHYFGVILPKNPKATSVEICNDPKYQPSPPLGFTN